MEFGGEGGVESVLFFQNALQPAHEGIRPRGLFHAGNVARMRDKSRGRPSKSRPVCSQTKGRMTVHNYIQGLLREVLAAVGETESHVATLSVPEVVTISVSTDEQGLVAAPSKESGRVCFSVMVVPKIACCGMN